MLRIVFCMSCQRMALESSRDFWCPFCGNPLSHGVLSYDDSPIGYTIYPDQPQPMGWWSLAAISLYLLCWVVLFIWRVMC